MSYSEKLKNPRWQRKRLEILERDGWKCSDCSNADAPLHVHHSHYARGNPWDTPNDMLLSLCDDCHDARGQVEADIKELFGFMLAATSLRKLEALAAQLRAAATSNPPKQVRLILEDQKDA